MMLTADIVEDGFDSRMLKKVGKMQLVNMNLKKAHY